MECYLVMIDDSVVPFVLVVVSSAFFALVDSFAFKNLLLLIFGKSFFNARSMLFFNFESPLALILSIKRSRAAGKVQAEQSTWQQECVDLCTGWFLGGESLPSVDFKKKKKSTGWFGAHRVTSAGVPGACFFTEASANLSSLFLFCPHPSSSKPSSMVIAGLFAGI